MSTIDQQFIEFIVKSLVSQPDAVSVERRIDEKGVLLELTVDPEDLGRVIGKRGATAQSLRTLLRALGTKNDARYNLKIVDTGEGSHYNGGTHDTSATPSPAAQEPAAEVEEQPEEPEGEEEAVHEETSDVVSKTRKELEDLDDLDV